MLAPTPTLMLQYARCGNPTVATIEGSIRRRRFYAVVNMPAQQMTDIIRASGHTGVAHGCKPCSARTGVAQRTNKTLSPRAAIDPRHRRVLVILRSADVGRLVAWKQRFDEIQVRIAWLDGQRRDELAEMLLANHSQCGCVAARWGLVVGALLAAALVSGFIDVPGGPFSKSIGAMAYMAPVGVLVLCPLLAMLVRVAIARWRIAQVSSDFAAKEKPTRPHRG